MIFEQITDMENLREAWLRVRANRAAPGIDRVTWQSFEKNLTENLTILQNQLKSEKYRPLPIILYNEKKGCSKDSGRAVGISSFRDKVVQQAILKVMAPYFEKNFLQCSYAYRPKKSALSAVGTAGALIKKGNFWALQMDVEKFFDTMDHDILLNLIGKVLDEKPLIRLISKLLKAKIFKEMGMFDTIAGSQQGSGLSPFLSNIYMHPADIFLWNNFKDRYLRYSDDITVFAKERDELEQAKQTITRCLAELKLSVNERKSVITHVSEGIIYLGYYMDIKGKGPSKKSVDQIQNRLQAFGAIRKTDNVSEKLKEITVIVRGWYNYYKTLKPITPPNILSLITLAKLADEFKETGYARELLKRSSNFNHSNPQICYELGELFSAAGMQNQAMREYARAIELDPSMEAAKDKVRLLQEGETDIHKAIEKLQLVLHHNPEYREGYQKLAGYYMELGLFGFAEKAHQKALEIDDDMEGLESIIPDGLVLNENGFDYHTIDQELFLALFSGRHDVHAKQWIDERGRWGFIRVERPLKKKDIYKHLKGEVTLAVYPVTESDMVHFIVFDVDTANRKILESETGSTDEFRKKSHQDILRIKTVCEQMSLALYLEDSGYKGRHGWLFFSEAVNSTRALQLGREIMEKAGGPSKDMIWELFPMGKSDRHNSIIKLPLGINRKNNRRCLFLSEENKPFTDQAIYLKTVKKNDAAKIDTLIRKWEKEDIQAELQTDAADLEISPGLSKMIDGCKIISYMISKARDTNYLNHFERMLLLYTLTFSGEEGEKYLHKVIGYCINYDANITSRHIERRKESPISCAKIAEYFPELAETIPCNCKFDLPPRGYPSPVLYLLESEFELAAFDPCKNQNDDEIDKKMEEKNNKSEIAEDSLNQLLDFENIFKSEYVFDDGTQKSESMSDKSDEEFLKPVESEPDQHFPGDISGDIHHETEINKAQENKNRQNGDIDPVASENEDYSPEVWNLTLEYMNLLHQEVQVNTSLKNINERLSKIFDDAVANEIHTPAGIVKREKNQNGNNVWILTGKTK